MVRNINTGPNIESSIRGYPILATEPGLYAGTAVMLMELYILKLKKWNLFDYIILATILLSIIFTYSGFVMVSLITSRYKKRIDAGLNVGSVYKFTASGVIFALVYDTWTNFGVFWLTYNHTVENLVLVYILGLPFMLYHLISSVVTFTLVGFPLYYLLASEVEYTNKNQNDNLISDE